MICEECGNDEVCEGFTYCSECLEGVAVTGPITVFGHRGDWVVDCLIHDLRVTCTLWEDAYEIALGHAAFKHEVAEVCARKGHAWEHKYPSRRSDLWACRRCQEPGWQIWDATPIAINA